MHAYDQHTGLAAAYSAPASPQTTISIAMGGLLLQSPEGGICDRGRCGSLFGDLGQRALGVLLAVDEIVKDGNAVTGGIRYRQLQGGGGAPGPDRHSHASSSGSGCSR